MRGLQDADRPFLHPSVRLQGEAAGCVVPVEEEPHGFRVGTVAVAEAPAISVVQCEAAVRSRMSAQRCRLSDRFRSVLADRVVRQTTQSRQRGNHIGPGFRFPAA